ncbi:MAG: DUF4112 domain-containing protein [Symploca sp. SIO2E6]|nr:DUF4112 domain-containing protein [Symploca sp. SIO2E6]
MSKLPRQSSENQKSTLRHLRQLSHLLDNAIPIPGTPYRFGLDPILGLLPGGGDFLSTIFSAYIVFKAAQIGISRSLLQQMVLNILVDTLSGTVPFLGDLVDVAWKANVKNIKLLEEHWDVPQAPQKTDWWFLVLLLGGLFLIMMVVVAISVTILGWLVGIISRLF